MNALQKKSHFFTCFCAIASAIFVILRIINFIFFYDSAAVYYKSGAPLPIIADCLLIATVIFLGVFSFVNFRKKTLKSKEVPTALRVASVVTVSGAFLLLSVNDIAGAIMTKTPLLFAYAVLSILAAVYFILTVTGLSETYKVVFGVLSIIRVLLMLASSYFNQEVAMNTPDKLIYGIACVFAMTFIVSELKLTVETPRSWLYMLSAGAFSVIGFTASIPSVIAFCMGKLPDAGGIFTEYFVLLGLSLYSAIRLASAVVNATDASEPSEASATAESGDQADEEQ